MYNHLTREQRYAIYLGQQRKDSMRAIVRQIGVSPLKVQDGRTMKWKLESSRNHNSAILFANNTYYIAAA